MHLMAKCKLVPFNLELSGIANIAFLLGLGLSVLLASKTQYGVRESDAGYQLELSRTPAYRSIHGGTFPRR